METLELVQGCVAVCNERVVVICGIHRDGRIKIRDLASARVRIVSSGSLTAAKEPDRERRADALHEKLTRTNSKQYKDAKRRESCVVDVLSDARPFEQAVSEIASKEGISSRTLLRWVSAYRRWPSLESLLLDGRGVRSNARRLPAATETLINRAIDNIYLTQPKGSYEAVTEEVWRLCDASELRRPSRNAVIRRLKGLDPWIVARHQLGREEAKRRLGAKPGSLSVQRPLAFVQIDHTRVDVHVVDDKHRRDIGRPWITLAIDVATRCIVGFHLSLEAPSSLSVAACLTQTCLPKDDWLEARGIETQWPIWGLPQKLHADNAKEFKTEALSRGCSEWGIQLDWRPIGSPHYGGHIERLIGTLMGRIHLLPGSSDSNPQKRGKYKPDKKSRLTMTELEHWIALEITGRYHMSIHRSLRKAPLHAWQDWFADRGKHPAVPSDSDRLRLSFMPIIYRKLSPQGIRFNHIQYWDDALLAIGHMKAPMLLRYDPRDISCLFALDDKGRYWRIPYADVRLPSITLAEAQAATKLMDRQERKRSTGQLVVKRALKQREIVEKAEGATRKVRRDHQRTSDAKRQIAQHKNTTAPSEAVNFNEDPPEYDIEFWDE